MTATPIARKFGSVSMLGLAELMLENSDKSMTVYVIVCGGSARAVRRKLTNAMMHCIEQWSVVPVFIEPGHWRAELGALFIEIYELKLEP